MSARSSLARVYHPEGSLEIPRPAYLRQLYRHLNLDPKTPDPRVFDCESLSHFRQKGVKALFDSLKITGASKVLSLGEGSGAPSRLLVKLTGCRVLGVDILPAQVSLARSLAPLHGVSSRVDYLCQDVHALALGRRRFDRLYCNESAFHWRDKELALRKALGYLKRGGLVGINDCLRGDRGGLSQAWSRVRSLRLFHRRDYWFASTLAEYRALLGRLGLKLLEARDVTDEVDAGLRRYVSALELLRESLDERSLRGIRYLKTMLLTHYDYLRYGRIIARFS